MSSDERKPEAPRQPVAVLALHSQLAAVAWAFAQAAPGRRLGYVRTDGGALAGARPGALAPLLARGLLAGHVSAGAARGEEHEPLTTAGALDHALRSLGWDAAVCGPGPETAGGDSPEERGEIAALDAAHVSLALGCPTLLVARMSSGDGTAGRRGIARDTLAVLDRLLAPVTVALPAGVRSPVGADLRAGLRSVFDPGGESDAGARPGAATVGEEARPARIARHDWRRAAVDLPAFAADGLAGGQLGGGGRSVGEVVRRPLFFGAALAAGAVLAEMLSGARGGRASFDGDGEGEGAYDGAEAASVGAEDEEGRG